MFYFNQVPDGKASARNGTKIAICIGINNYPGTKNDLRGCVNDARAWAQLLSKTYGFDTMMLLDKDVKRNYLIKLIEQTITNSSSGDEIAITYSGHGTNLPDRNGDESDGRDEALVLYDGYLIDDSIRSIFKKLHPNAALTFISDSCHSGTVTRAFLTSMQTIYPPYPRYLPPEDDEEALAQGNIKNKIFHPEENMNEILISGCLDSEYSYDTYLGGKYRGAMSYYAIDILQKTPQITYEDFYKKLRQKLPSSRLPQTPQLEGSSKNKKRIMFSRR